MPLIVNTLSMSTYIILFLLRFLYSHYVKYIVRSPVSVLKMASQYFIFPDNVCG